MPAELADGGEEVPEPNWPPRPHTGHRGDERCWEYDDAHYALLIRLVRGVERFARQELSEVEDVDADAIFGFVQIYAQRSVNLTLEARNLAAMYEEFVTGPARDPSAPEELLSCTRGFFDGLRLVVGSVGITEMWGFDEVRGLLSPERWEIVRGKVVQMCSDLLDEDKFQAELAEARKMPLPSGAKVLPFRTKPR